MLINMQPTLVSIIVVNYNDSGHLHDCLGSIFDSTYPNIEVIVVDNGSTDGSLEEIKKDFSSSEMVVVSNESNVGPAAARNIGARKSRGELLAFLDSDTIVSPDWLESIIELMTSDSKIAVAQCKLLLKNSTRYDYAGDYLSQFGILVQRVRLGDLDNGTLDYVSDIFSAKGAAMLVRKSVFDIVGGFDEDFFIYVEETDLCWRAWLAGYRVVFAPTSMVYHDFDRTKKREFRPQYLDKYYGPRNYITTFFKNLGTRELIEILSVNVGVWVSISMLFLSKKRLQDAKWIVCGLVYNLANFRRIWMKRSHIQRNIRKVTDEDLMKIVMKRMPLSYFEAKIRYPGSGWNPEAEINRIS
jgi:GT2 family glycosyltransferase